MRKDNLITRRTVLGAAVGGIAVANAAVLALKQNYSIDSRHLSSFGPDWNECVELVAIPASETEGPSTFTLNFSPQRNSDFRVLTLTGSYRNGAYPQVPATFFAMQGGARVVAPIHGSEPTLLISAEEKKFGVQGKRDAIKGGQCLIVPAKANVKYYASESDGRNELSPSHVAFPCLEIGSIFSLPYPTGETFSKGHKWLLQDCSYHVELPFEVTGFANLNNRKTVRMSAVQQLSNRQFLERLALMNKKSRESENSSKGGVDQSGLSQELLHASKERVAMRWHVERYVDLETGVPLREELTVTTTTSGGHVSSSATTIRQIFIS